MPLTAKQQRFVAEYLVDHNGSRAAVAAGYGKAGSRVAACRLLANDNVKAVIAAVQAKEAEHLQIKRQDALAGLLSAVDLAREQRNPAAMIAAWREIGRMLGFYEPERRTVEVKASAELERLERLSDEELVELLDAQG